MYISMCTWQYANLRERERERREREEREREREKEGEGESMYMHMCIHALLHVVACYPCNNMLRLLFNSF